MRVAASCRTCLIAMGVDFSLSKRPPLFRSSTAVGSSRSIFAWQRHLQSRGAHTLPTSPSWYLIYFLLICSSFLLPQTPSIFPPASCIIRSHPSPSLPPSLHWVLTTL